MIEIESTSILEMREDCYTATTTFTVESPVPGKFTIEVAGKTITEVVQNLIDHIREHSDEDESVLLGIETVIFGLIKESTEILRLRDISVVNSDDLLPNQDFAEWDSEEKPKVRNWTIPPNTE